MIRPHIFLTDKPLDRGSNVYGLCGHLVFNASEVFFWLDTPRPEYSEFVSTFNTCQKCLDALKAAEPSKERQYIYGITQGQEAFDAERAFQEMSAA